ncbi:MAG TPA: CARDB domain-containing protein [Bacteroidales bacterium]|nr:CARDB domain-containing protein [Bacteroidales bacterium]
MKLFYIILICTLFVDHKIPNVTHRKHKCCDLIVKKIDAPDWINGRTVVFVEIKNIGNSESKPTKVKLFDLDLSITEALKLELDNSIIEIIEENAENHGHYCQEDSYLFDTIFMNNTGDYDSDKYFEAFKEIPSLKPRESIRIEFQIENYWIYDPNCEIEVIIDPDNAIEECDKTNNKLQFFAWG